MTEELKKRDMPLDLALLPIVESAYHPFAYSRSHASGIWQFIPSTGRIYGLKQNWWYDGRRDIIAATNAALNYLEKLYNQFDGDWQHALASYNSGEYNVARSIRRNRSANKATDFFSLRLPRETRGYVPSLLAVSEIISNPEKYGINLIPIPDRAYFEKVEIDGQLDLSTAATLSDLTMDELYTLNPGFNRWATDPDGPHYMLIPLDKSEQFLNGLKDIPPDERVGWNRHVIKQGETLSEIAERYKTSITIIKQSNNLRSNLI
ncbi:MAG: transglycosylase SLT domain-containing protein, partial [Gammaproteobacteria bacterium]|nr:transglycosylase SLT domain-containing protein [Gammaproteobacteria bacterium]